MPYHYQPLVGPFEDKQKYNVFGVVKEVRKDVHRDEKGRLKSIIVIVDESLEIPFKVSIFCRSAQELIPDIQQGWIVRLHRMQTELYNGTIDGRVFCAETDIVVFPEGYPIVDWISIKKTTVTDSNKDRVMELQAWMQALRDFEACMDDDFDQSHHDGSGSTERASDVNPVKATKKGTDSSKAGQDDSSSTNTIPRFLDTEPPVIDLISDKNSKDLVRWECICGEQFISSKMIWLPNPENTRNLGCTKCPHCGTEGLAIPRYYFFTLYEQKPNQKEKVLLHGETAREFLGTSVQSYLFEDGANIDVHNMLAVLSQERTSVQSYLFEDGANIDVHNMLAVLSQES